MTISIMDLMTTTDMIMLGVVAFGIFVIGFVVGHIATSVTKKR